MKIYGYFLIEHVQSMKNANATITLTEQSHYSHVLQ